MENKANQNMDDLMAKLENFITTKTVVGEPIHIEDTILVPLVDVSFGVAAGSTASSKFSERKKETERKVDGGTDAGAGGLGARMTPSAMLVIQNGTTQLISIKGQDSVTKLIDMIPGLLAKVPDLVTKFTHEGATAKEKKAPKNQTETAVADKYHTLDEENE
ncbi:sporulation protein [Sporanaerobium hydrogeniformans]|uniref:Sporulation protein n=1 Tax=Sporanaerobium hydrogeniformans TaxID=3072179 RepID=A0AC61DDZ2_9FIRM|nr:GerW family sporulation protein [Sporanaerobium hydrogeniformans]PHV71080.1 sporulation protein [Sporanaerobium hydrogeniformans]